MSSSTIVAISTPQGRGGVAVVRVSGPDAFHIHARLSGRDARPGRISFGNVCGDECVMLAFKAPHSYTGEDVVEFQCHGGIIAPRRILDACIKEGARLARRGEFTERAFLSGRISYDQAEAVIDLIDAKTPRAAEDALLGLSGLAKRRLRACYDAAVEVSSTIEYSLDVDEGELPGDFIQNTDRKISSVSRDLDELAAWLRRRSMMREGALVVFAGEPNAGKSSLFNALVEENRAIVSPVAGTTRDAIEAWIDIEGWPVRLVDTAGLRETGDAIESEGVARAEDLLRKADIILCLGPLPSDIDTQPSSIIHIRAKCDLGRGDGLNVSAKTGEGIDALRAAIAAALEKKACDEDEDESSASETAVAAAREALAHLDSALSCGADLVLKGNKVRAAAQTLGRHIGAEYSSDMLEALFSRFCVGK